ncbi:MAG: acylphosphatase [Verrucomicrobiaceae bacterium]|nr:acylphosphatase [Verrucomicrobiaceae bacterium]
MAAKSVFYSGRVQGVGFRFAVKRIASGYDVCGWVKNLPDGRVELHAQASEADELDAFLTAILESDLRSHIREHDTSDVAMQKDLGGFFIRRDS